MVTDPTQASTSDAGAASVPLISLTKTPLEINNQSKRKAFDGRSCDAADPFLLDTDQPPLITPVGDLTSKVKVKVGDRVKQFILQH